MIKPSNTLKAFLRSYLKWVDDGAADWLPFRRNSGLCTNFAIWLNYQDIFVPVQIEMMKLFEQEGLDPRWPFNESFHEYEKDSINGTQHLNAKRIDWARRMLEIE